MMITSKQSNENWERLTPDSRQAIRDMVPHFNNHNTFNRGVYYCLCQLFGECNIQSPVEPEEMLMVEREEVMELYSNLSKEYKEEINGSIYKISLGGGIAILETLFTKDKCLPDKELNEDNFAKSELEHRLEQTVQESVQVEPCDAPFEDMMRTEAIQNVAIVSDMPMKYAKKLAAAIDQSSVNTEDVITQLKKLAKTMR